jgi:hypothetical protein
MKATARIFTALVVTLGFVAPAPADGPASMPEELTNEIRAQGAAALGSMTTDGTRLDGRERALDTLQSALEGSVAAVAQGNARGDVPCAEGTQAVGTRNALVSQPVSLPTVRLPHVLRVR